MPLSSPAVILTAAVTIFAALICFWSATLVARIRRRHKIPAPSMTGPLELESAFRAQANTTEQAVLFFPLLWMAALYFHAVGWLVPALGLLWCIGRIWFVLGYVNAPAKRFPGFALGQIAAVVLAILAIVGVAQAWTAS